MGITKEVKPIFVARVYAEDAEMLYNIQVDLHNVLSKDYYVIVLKAEENTFEVLNARDADIEELKVLFEKAIK